MPDRDRSLDAALRRVLSDNGSATPQPACVDGETLAAWTAGSLRADEAATVERHVADCARCQAIMAALYRTEPVLPASESVWHKWRLGWMVPLATAATAAALWIALPRTTPVVPTVDVVTSTVASGAPAQQAADQMPPPAAAPSAIADRERDQSARIELQQRVDARAGNEARQQLDETLMRKSVQDRIASVAEPAEPAAEADRREFAPSAPGAAAAPTATAAPQAGLAARALVSTPEIVAPGGLVRWRIVNGQQVERSTTGGSEWTAANINSTENLTAGASPSPSICWIVGRGGAVFVTTDGMRFERIPFPERIDLVAVTAVDDATATASSADGRSWRTVDRGRTWSPVR